MYKLLNEFGDYNWGPEIFCVVAPFMGQKHRPDKSGDYYKVCYSFVAKMLQGLLWFCDKKPALYTRNHKRLFCGEALVVVGYYADKVQALGNGEFGGKVTLVGGVFIVFIEDLDVVHHYVYDPDVLVVLHVELQVNRTPFGG